MDIKAIKKLKVRYQPIILPGGEVIEKKCTKSVQDSRKKVIKLFADIDFSKKTYLDIGCAEGFFLREAIKRGARFARGIDIDDVRVEVNKCVNNLWKYSDETIKVTNEDFRDLNEQYDIVSCIAILHHYQRMEDGVKFLDTWKMITDRRYSFVLKNHLELMKFIASLTREVAIIEYPYTYEFYETRRKDIDFELLGKIWEEAGIFTRVDFKGFVQKSKIKDRVVYYAYKKNERKHVIPERQYDLDAYDYKREAKGISFQIENSVFIKKYDVEPTVYSPEERNRRFKRELAVYKYFKEINWDKSPRLLEYSEENLSLKIERFKFRSIHEYLSERKFLNLVWLIKELNKLERDLIKNKINCLGITNKDIMVGDGKLWLIDFEETEVNSPYSQSLPLQLIIDLRKRWNTFYKKNKQKRDYRYLLYFWAFRQLLTFEFYNLKRLWASFKALLYSYWRLMKRKIIGRV